MFRYILMGRPTLAALACLLIVPQISLAQYSSFPGDWPQPGRGPGYGHSGYGGWSDALAFPYNGLGGTHSGPAYASFRAYAVVPYTAPTVAQAFVRVHVPADAKVFFDKSATVQTGSDRLFVTPPLDRGERYSYAVSARWIDNGKERRETRTVPLIAGQTVDVDFAR
jgi:uncharacterized protein (TIGR03000 family)